MARVVLENLTRIFTGPGGEPIGAVQNLNLTVEDKELLVLVGPSGCGKTTLLRIIAGLERADKGSIRIGEQDVTRQPPKERDVAMVFQNYALYPHMSAFENIAFGLKLRNFPKPEIQKRVHETAELLGLSPCLERKPDELSGGERQRIALGRAIVRQPAIVLLDEPLSNLDAPMRLQTRTEIARLHQRTGATMLYVTHDQVEAMTLGQRIAVMQQGVLQQVDLPLAVYSHPVNRFVGTFIGSPPMNLFPGTLVRKPDGLLFEARLAKGISSADGFCLRLDERFSPQLRDYPGKELILGIRPEHISQKYSAAASKIEATVELIQLVGGESLVWMASGGYSFVSRVPSRARLTVREPIWVEFDMAQAHFFDAQTQKRIGS